MNKKIILTIFMLSILTIASIASAYIVKVNSFNNESENSTIKIRVALYTDEDESNPEFYGPNARTCYFVYALRDYTWQIGNTTYSFKIDFMPSKELFKGKLTKENYDVFLYNPIQADYEKNPDKVKENLLPFIKDGGGYFGICASAMMMGTMKNIPETGWEKSWKKRELGISGVNINIKGGTPLFNQLFGGKPEDLGPTAMYTWVSGFNSSNYYVNHFGGVCLDFIINTSHPIFNDYLNDKRRVRWIGSPPLIIPEDTEREISSIATFPEEEMSDNESTRIHYWKYTGGFCGLIKGLFTKKESYWSYLSGLRQRIMLFSGDWEKTDKIVETNYKNKSGMTAEIYPNKNKARIVLSPIHPEYNVWWDGHIEEIDTEDNNIFEGLNIWTNITPIEETPEDEFSYNYWIIRRSIAWASQKVPDNDLPPIYGASQVCDIIPYNQSSSFTIEGNAETSEGIAELELYYRYKSDNESCWSNWTLFGIDIDDSNGWSWNFDSPEGPGYYEFYSIRNVEYEGYVETEKAPPGPDAVVHVIDQQ